MRHRRLGPRPSRQPFIARPAGQYDEGRTAVELVLELLGTSQSTRRGGLAVEDRRVDAAGVHPLHHHPVGGDFEVFQFGKVRGRPMAQRRLTRRRVMLLSLYTSTVKGAAMS